MYNTFISVVTLVSSDRKTIFDYLSNIHKVLRENFEYYEIILINNGLDPNLIKEATSNLHKDLKKDITLINLSKRLDPDNAIVAGLDRANGDYTVIYDMDLSDKAELIIDLYKKTQENYDIVYLKYKKRNIPLQKRIFFKAFYYIMRKHSDLVIDISMHKCRIISRRALNSIIKVRENLRYMKGIFSFVGYKKCALEADIPESKVQEKLSNQFRAAIIAIISFTDILNKLLLRIFFLAIIFSCFVTSDALLIRFTGADIFGEPAEHNPIGYLTILISIMFTILCMILYILSIYLSSVNSEIKQRPVYFIESIQRIE